MSAPLTSPPTEHCWTGVAHTGESTGKVETIGGAETYVALPPQGAPMKGVLLFYADVWGCMFLNNRLLQDYFATQGFIVVGIDYLARDPIYIHNEDPNFDRPAWFQKQHKGSREMEPVWWEAIQARYGKPNETNYFAIGYCFGAPFVMEACVSDKAIAGALVHPASLNESHIENVQKPIFFSCAETDHTFGLEARRKAEDVLVAAKKQYHFQVFAGVKHGFSIRGDPAVENERWAKEESARSIAGWFTRWGSL